jgi:FixJ family two-component response regulator
VTALPHVLIVDDLEERRARLRHALTTHLSPFAVSEAVSGADCLAQLSSGRWDALLLSDRLPDASGLELLDRLSAAGIDLPVLLLAAPGDTALADEASRRGVAGTLFRSDDLERALPDAVARAILQHGPRAAERCAALYQWQLEPLLRTARTVWHDVNNPLFAIEGSAQLLLVAGFGADEAYRGHLERIQRACERIQVVMQQLREATLHVLRATGQEGAPVDLPDHQPPVSSYEP